MTSRASPSAKRAATTVPARWRAARSGRAGVMRGSPAPTNPALPPPTPWWGRARSLAIARHEQAIERAGRLAFGTLRTSRLGALVPRIDVAMQPSLGGGHEAAQEQRRRDRAGEAPARDIVDVGDLGIKQLIVGAPQRQPPQRIALDLGAASDLVREPVVVRVEG